MTRHFTPEFELAIQCSLRPASVARDAAVQEAANSSPIDWYAFLRIVERHKISALAHDGLTGAGVEMPSVAADQLRARVEDNAKNQLALAAAAFEIQKIFNDASIPALFLKGPPLAKLAFGNLALRESKDLDILIPTADLPKAAALLENQGYRRFSPPEAITAREFNLRIALRKDIGYYSPRSDIEIELHWKPFLNQYFFDCASMYEDAQVVSFGEGAFLRTLGRDDLFAYLCGHGALHWWRDLRWLADIGALLDRTYVDDVEHLRKAAKARGVERAVEMAFGVNDRLLATPSHTRSTNSYLERLIVRWLENTAIAAISANDPLGGVRGPFRTTRGSATTLLLRRTAKYRLTEIALHLRSETDISDLSLPARLQFLYPFARAPMWLWRRIAGR